MREINLDLLKSAIPKKSARLVTQSLVDTINNLNNDQDEIFAETYKENFISYLSVVRNGEYGLDKYMSAVKFVSHRLMGDNMLDSYRATFPERYTRLLIKYKDKGDEKLIRTKYISPFVSAYAASKLVSKILEQSLVSIHILNAPMQQEALNVLINVMYTSKSDKNRVDAAVAVLAATKAPESAHIKIDIGIEQSDAISELNDSLSTLATAHKAMLESGEISLKALGSLKVKDEFDDVEIVNE